MKKLVKEELNEIYSEKDFKRGEDLDKTDFGAELKFEGDYRKEKLIIKKLVRLKYKISDENLKNEIDQILDLIENN